MVLIPLVRLTSGTSLDLDLDTERGARVGRWAPTVTSPDVTSCIRIRIVRVLRIIRIMKIRMMRMTRMMEIMRMTKMTRMTRTTRMLTRMLAEEGQQLSGRRNLELGLMREGTDLILL